MLCKCLTISDDGENGQIHLSFPEGAFLQGNAISRGSKDVPERNKQKCEFLHPPAFLVSALCDRALSIHWLSLTNQKHDSY